MQPANDDGSGRLVDDDSAHRVPTRWGERVPAGADVDQVNQVGPVYRDARQHHEDEHEGQFAAGCATCRGHEARAQTRLLERILAALTTPGGQAHGPVKDVGQPLPTYPLPLTATHGSQEALTEQPPHGTQVMDVDGDLWVVANSGCVRWITEETRWERTHVPYTWVELVDHHGPVRLATPDESVVIER